MKQAFYSRPKQIWTVAEGDKQAAGYSCCVERAAQGRQARFCYVIMRTCNSGHEATPYAPPAAHDLNSAKNHLGLRQFRDVAMNCPHARRAVRGGALRDWLRL